MSGWCMVRDGVFERVYSVTATIHHPLTGAPGAYTREYNNLVCCCP